MNAGELRRKNRNRRWLLVTLGTILFAVVSILLAKSASQSGAASIIGILLFAIGMTDSPKLKKCYRKWQEVIWNTKDLTRYFLENREKFGPSFNYMYRLLSKEDFDPNGSFDWRKLLHEVPNHGVLLFEERIRLYEGFHLLTVRGYIVPNEDEKYVLGPRLRREFLEANPMPDDFIPDRNVETWEPATA